TVSFDYQLLKAINDLCHRENITPFIVLIAALGVTLRKWTGQDDIVIGTVVAGRTNREIEDLIGCFINFLPLRISAQDSVSGHDFLKQVRTTVTEAQDHQGCPFEKIVEAINPERTLNQNPLYNVGLLLQDQTEHYFTAGGKRSEPFPIAIEAALLDLRFEAVQRGPE